VMDILTQLLGSKVGHDFREDARRPLVDSANDTAHHALRHTTPRTSVQPGLAFEGLLAFDVAVAQGPCGQARALGAAPPAQPGQGKAPQDRCLFVPSNDRAPANSGLEGSEFERSRGEVSRGGIESSGGPTGGSRVFFHPPRTRARPTWTPVCWANTVANVRQRHGEEREPCGKGS
jgi:hypothetical protein